MAEPLTAQELDDIKSRLTLYRTTATAMESGMLAQAAEDVVRLLATVEQLQVDRAALMAVYAAATHLPYAQLPLALGLAVARAHAVLGQ
jgi:hypothetical protein